MSVEISRLFDFAYFQRDTYNLERAFNTKYDGKWVSTSSETFLKEGNRVSRGLLKLGIKPGEKIAVISSNNRTEWNLLDFGLLQIGGINIPIYPTISEQDYAYIFNHAEITYCFLSDDELLKKANAIKDQVPSLKEIYSFDQLDGCKHWSEVQQLGDDESLQTEVEDLMKTVKPHDMATIIYTSGTTGRPKGVMLTHNNVVTNVLDSLPRIPFEVGKDVAMSFLPVCHIFERMVQYMYIYAGLSIYFAESLEKIGENIKEIKPHFMTVVPRLLEKVYDGIIAKGTELKGIKKMLFFWAVNLGLRYKPYNKNGWWYHKKLALANKLIFSKWREALGGNLRNMVTGSAAMQPRLIRVFTAAGMTVLEGYGLTETSPVISVNMYKDKHFKIGSVGKPIANVEVKIADDGEILCKGPNIMVGYYKDPEKTASVMTGDYFHTGDKGEIDADGFLKITGRKKEIFKTSGGKYIAPGLLENEMKESRFIEQILVIGEGQKMPAALIQPNFPFVIEWMERHDLKIPANASNEEIIAIPEVRKRIKREIEKRNKKFARWETIKDFELTPDVWHVDNGLLTPTMKPKRTEILKKYKELYNKIYGV
jgi:long-chain acyl-CoA synthetase